MRLITFGKNAGALLLVAVVMAGAIGLLARLTRGPIGTSAVRFDAEKARQARALREVRIDRHAAESHSPYLNAQVIPAHESPLLADLVKKGRLPPLKDRLPEDPVVMQGPDGIGQYGGTWVRLANAEGDIPGQAYWRLAGTFLCRWSPFGDPVVPFLAKSVVPSKDQSVWTITLRKGLRWSNGDPYTTDDVLYWWNDVMNNKFLSNNQTPNYPDWLLVEGEPPRIEKIDDYQYRVTFKAPYPLFMKQLCTHQGGNLVGSPSKYMRRYNPDPKIGNKALIGRDMKAYKQPSARALYGFMGAYQNTDCPRLAPWIYTSYRSRPPQVFVRNPYYYAVDPAGNQLPYIDRLQFEVKENQQILAMSIANGDATMQDRNVDFASYTELMSRRESAHTRVLHWYPATRQEWVINPNNNRKIIFGEPAARWKEKLLSDKRFRQAMSMAINRRQIIAAQYFGVGEASQVSPGPMSDFDNPDLATKYAEYEPGKANDLLDGLGLTGRDYEGYRTFPDGSRMTFFIDYCPFTGEGPLQFVVDDWKAVGMRVMRRQLTRSLFSLYAQSGDFDFNVWASESDIVPLLEPSYFIPRDSNWAWGWSRWFKLGGFYGKPRAAISGINPMDNRNGKPMYEAVKIYEEALRAPDLARQQELFRQIEQIAAENVWSIGIATAPPGLVVVNDDLRNVPERAMVGPTFSTPSNTAVETYFFAHPTANPSADADLEYSIVHPTNRPGAKTKKPAGTLIVAMLVGILIAGTLMVGLKHPFVLRRFVIFIPMLLVISVVVFAIVQLPPGDFVSNRRAELEAVQDPNLEQQLADLQAQFHTNDAVWKNYCRWVGFTWFTSFKAADEGLLQGSLGRSMEANLPVDDIIGDRVTLTFLLSLGTVLFTWMLAVPIGIYSAVRQYTISDYAFTLLGFIGMSVPAFLLALVLMAMSGFTGLYSPQYATQPGWSWGKIVDLGAHLWVPVVVLAVGGTAGMIRIMRANLLDELRKPYVVTARAKGVKPLKLLLKYPVRIALNPFVSGIGHLFPALVSGGSIVAIVLALPMVGPVLLNALFAQDVYLASSMLMVLSLLGVLGTLVSDLLLLWLDPRIRFEGGTR